MAKIRAQTADLDKLVSGMDTLGNTIDDIADEVLNAAAPTVVEAYRSAIQAAASSGYSTGAAAASVSATEAKMNAYGHFIAARPTGSDANGVRNGEKLAYLEYGTWKQPAHPFIAAAAAAADGPATEQVKSAVEAKVGELCGE